MGGRDAPVQKGKSARSFVIVDETLVGAEAEYERGT